MSNPTYPNQILAKLRSGIHFSKLTPQEQAFANASIPIEEVSNAMTGFASGERVKLDKQIGAGKLKYTDVYSTGGMKKSPEENLRHLLISHLLRK